MIASLIISSASFILNFVFKSDNDKEIDKLQLEVNMLKSNRINKER